MNVTGIREATAGTRTAADFLVGDAATMPVPASQREGGDGFAAHLQGALVELEQTTAQADATSEGLVTGEVDIHEAMVAMEKADLVLRVAGTVRNKVIDAYQQLMQASGG